MEPSPPPSSFAGEEGRLRSLSLCLSGRHMHETKAETERERENKQPDKQTDTRADTHTYGRRGEMMDPPSPIRGASLFVPLSPRETRTERPRQRERETTRRPGNQTKRQTTHTHTQPDRQTDIRTRGEGDGPPSSPLTVSRLQGRREGFALCLSLFLRQRHTDTKAETDRKRERGRDNEKNRDNQTNRQTDRQTNRHTNRQTDRQTDRQAYLRTEGGMMPFLPPHPFAGEHGPRH